MCKLRWITYSNIKHWRYYITLLHYYTVLLLWSPCYSWVQQIGDETPLTLRRQWKRALVHGNSGLLLRDFCCLCTTTMIMTLLICLNETECSNIISSHTYSILTFSICKTPPIIITAVLVIPDVYSIHSNVPYHLHIISSAHYCYRNSVCSFICLSVHHTGGPCLIYCVPYDRVMFLVFSSLILQSEFRSLSQIRELNRDTLLIISNSLTSTLW